MKFKIILFFLFVILQACTTVSFEEPQPSDEPDLQSIPSELNGKYMSLLDSSVFTVNDRLAIRESIVVVSEALNNLDSLYSITPDTFLVYKDSLHIKAKIINDTIHARFNHTDTVFNLSAENVLRKYKNSYFMNVLEDEGWEVTKLDPRKNKLFISTISSKEDVRKLRIITETNDTTQTVFKPTPAQFKKFVRKKGFGNEDVFVKINS